MDLEPTTHKGIWKHCLLLIQVGNVSNNGKHYLPLFGRYESAARRHQRYEKTGVIFIHVARKNIYHVDETGVR